MRSLQWDAFGGLWGEAADRVTSQKARPSLNSVAALEEGLEAALELRNGAEKRTQELRLRLCPKQLAKLLPFIVFHEGMMTLDTHRQRQLDGTPGNNTQGGTFSTRRP